METLHGKRSDLQFNDSNQAKVSQSMVSDTGSNFEMMPRKTGASALIAHSDSSLRSARRSYFLPPVASCAFVVGCLVVSPPSWREASLPVAVPVSGPALGCFCACARVAMSFGDVAPWRHALRGLASHHPLTSNLHRQFSVPTKTQRTTTTQAINREGHKQETVCVGPHRARAPPRSPPPS